MRKLLSLAVAAMVAFAGINAYATPVKAKKSAAQKIEQTEKKVIAKGDKSAYETLDLKAIEKEQVATTQFAKAAKLPAVKPVIRKANAAGDPIVPPFSEDFTEDPAGTWTIIDANGDGKTWGWENGVMDIYYNQTQAMDDWLITPALQLEAGKMYPLTFDAWNALSSYKEKFEVCLGTAATAAAMTTVIIPATVVEGVKDTPHKVEGYIVPEADGVYYVGIHGISDPDMYYLNLDNVVIGAATSAAGPAVITDLAAATTAEGIKVTLTAPDKTIAGDALTELTSVVLKRDGTVIKTWDNPAPGAALEYIDTEATGFVTYTAVATSAQGSTKEASVMAFAGVLVPPFTEDFTNQGNTEAFTVIDSNDDERTWTWYNGAMRVMYNSAEAMDDWLITPAIKLEGGKVYEVSMDAYGYSASWAERVEVMMGDAATVAAMTKTVIPATEIAAASTAPQQIAGFITAATDGEYYVGIHGISDKDKFYLYIDNLSVSAPIDGGAPKAVEDLTVTPDPNCELKATIAFTAPSLNIAEQPVDALTEAEIYREDELIVTKTDITAGAPVSYVDENPINGVNKYTVIVKNAKGSSVPVSASAFVGVNKPADVENPQTTLADDNCTATFTWDAVTTTIDGDPLAAQFITYNLYKATEESIETVATGLTECTYTTQVCDPEDTCDFYQYAVKAETSAGESEYYAEFFFTAGKPETLPWIESFADGTLSHPLAVSGSLSVTLATDETFQGGTPASVDGDNGFILFYDPYQGWLMPGEVGLMTGLITIPADSNPALMFSVFNIANDDENYLDVIINGETVKTVEPTEGDMEWIDYTVDLAAYKGKTIQVEFYAHLNNYLYFIMDNIVILNVVDNEIIVKGISAPATVKANTEFDVKVAVQNMGSNAQTIDVTLYRNGEVVETTTTEELQFMESEEVVFTQTLLPIDKTDNVYYAVIEGQDTDESNNTSDEVSVLLTVPNYPTPTDAVANGGEGEITVTWAEPAATAGEKQPVTEDFENAEGFTSNVPGWTIADSDGGTMGGIDGIEINIEGSPWFVLDNSDEEVYNQSFEAHSGHKYMCVMYTYPAVDQDDWMISPALCGDAQTISLWCKTYGNYGLETLELMYSSTDMEAESFTTVKTIEAPAEWTEVEFDVPEGAKYFAIHCISRDIFMCFVDDVTYIPADAETVELELLGYNVYRDGELIAEGIEETNYIDTDVEGNVEYTYVVTAVYKQGESAGSNEATGMCATGLKAIDTAAATISTTNNSIIVANANGMNVTISSVDGKVLYNGAGDATVAATKGVYVVKVGKKVAKVIVR